MAQKKILLTELNMTPMIDCVFLLLLFFMVSMKFKELDRKLDTDMPKTGKPNPNDQNKLLTELWIRIAVKQGTKGPNAQAQYFLDQKAMGSKEELRAALARHAAIPGVTKDPVILAPTDEAQHGWVLTAMDYLHEFKYKSINFKQ